MNMLPYIAKETSVNITDLRILIWGDYPVFANEFSVITKVFINDRGAQESVIQRRRCDDSTRGWSDGNTGLEGGRGL